MATYTIIGGDQKPYGSVTADDIRRWIADGRLNAQSLAREENDTGWRALSEFPEFADALGAQVTAAGIEAAKTVAIPAGGEEGDYELDIGSCISRSWELVKNNFWPVVGVTTLVMLIIAAINQVFGLFTRSAINDIIVKRQVSPGGVAIIFLTIVISSPVYTIFMAGLFKYYLKLIRGESAGIGDAFSGFGPLTGQLILLSLVMNALTMLGYVLCLIPGIYLAVAWFFSIALVIDRRMNFWDAMGLSRRMVSKHWFLVFAFLLVYGLLSMAGLIACCVGIFVTLPIGLGALMYAYETIFPPAGSKSV